MVPPINGVIVPEKKIHGSTYISPVILTWKEFGKRKEGIFHKFSYYIYSYVTWILYRCEQLYENNSD